MNTAFKIIMAAILFLAVLYHFWRHRRAWVESECLGLYLIDDREQCRVYELEERVKELDAREISLPERSSMLHRTDFHDDYQTVMAYKVSEVIAAIRAAGIRIKGGE